MALGVGAIVKSVAGLGQTWLEGKVAKTKAKAEAEAAVMVKQAESVADWETAMARSSQQSWKDEWLTILFSIEYLLVKYCLKSVSSIIGFQNSSFKVSFSRTFGSTNSPVD